MRLDVLSLEQCEQVRLWRNECLETLRTPYPLTKEVQEEFYMNRVVNPLSSHRYWGIRASWCEIRGPKDNPAPYETWESQFIGMGGLTYIQWENRIAEISLILDPQYRGKGLGEKAVDLLLAEGFDRLGLKTIFGECYAVPNGAAPFWATVAAKYNAYRTVLLNRKFWGGKFYNSSFFSFDADDWRKVKNGQSA